MSLISNAGGQLGSPTVPVHIRTSGRDVVASGTVITADGRDLEFQLSHLRVVFSFVSDSGQTRLVPSAISGSALKLALYNFNNSIGSGTTSPIEIGTLVGRKLWLSFVVYAFSPESSKTVHYTFMLGD